MTMELTIGEQKISAKVIEEGTYTSEKSKKELRVLKVEFGIQGVDALDRYRELGIDAVRYGVLSEEKVSWTTSEYCSQWQQSPAGHGPNFYEAVWILREDER